VPPGAVAQIFFMKRTLATKTNQIHVGILLNRKPILLPVLSGFEKEYARYREGRLEAEQRPFQHQFYYKKGSLTEERWNKAQSQNAPFLVQPAEPELSEWVEESSKAPEANEEDFKSLDRKAREFLYLFVKKGDQWVLPESPLPSDPATVLHEV
jgi:large subunit ribosomal protein L46